VSGRHGHNDVDEGDDDETAVHDVPAARQVRVSAAYKPVSTHLVTDTTRIRMFLSVGERYIAEIVT